MDVFKKLGNILTPEKDEPDYCLFNYDEKACTNCPFNEFEMVGHPGGGCDGRVSVEKRHCELGYWKDDF